MTCIKISFYQIKCIQKWILMTYCYHYRIYMLDSRQFVPDLNFSPIHEGIYLKTFYSLTFPIVFRRSSEKEKFHNCRAYLRHPNYCSIHYKTEYTYNAKVFNNVLQYLYVRTAYINKKEEKNCQLKYLLLLCSVN